MADRVQPDEIYNWTLEALKSGLPIHVIRAEVESAFRLYVKTNPTMDVNHGG